MKQENKNVDEIKATMLLLESNLEVAQYSLNTAVSLQNDLKELLKMSSKKNTEKSSNS